MASTQPEVLPYCVAPAVAISEIGNGRWLAQSTSVTYGPNKYRPLHRERGGYYNVVQAWQGADDEALERIRGQRPALLIKWLSDSADLKGARTAPFTRRNTSFFCTLSQTICAMMKAQCLAQL